MTWGVATAIAVFVVLAVVTIKVEHFWKNLEDALRRSLNRKRKARDLKRNDVRVVASSHLAAYNEPGGVEQLFQASTLRGAVRVPVLVNEHSLVIRRIELKSDALLSIDGAQRVPYPVDGRLIRTTLAHGRRLTDDSVLYVDKVSNLGGQHTHITAGVTGYWATATLAHRVTRALLGRGHAGIDREDLSSLESALSSGVLRPMVIGSDAACVFQDGHRHVVAMHRRSAQTVNAPGAFTLTPAYTYEANRVAGVTSDYGVIGYNFLREFVEEFWGDDELVDSSARPRAHPDWIFESEPAKRLVAEVTAGRVDLHCVGIGVDVSHCCLTLALAARFSSPNFLKYVMSAPGGWEDSRAAGGRPAVEFPDLFGLEIEEMIRSGMKPTTVLAIDGARRLISQDSQ